MSHSEDTAGRGPLQTPLPPERGRWFGDLSQTDFDIDFFERLIDRSPQHVQVLRLLGELLARKGLYERSLPIDRRLVDLRPEDCVARYNLACSLAMCGQSGAAIQELQAAVAHGYRDFGYMEMDSDLDSLRSDPEFQRILKSKVKRRRSTKKKGPQ